MPVHLTEAAPGYPVYVIDHPAATARVALHGAHLLEWTPAGEAPVIYLSPEAIYQQGKAIRGGIPVCWPWFGPHPNDPSKPAHGLARSRCWALAETAETDAGVVLTFTLTDDPATRQLWPHAFMLQLRMTIGASLDLALQMTNTGDTPCTVTGALHTYFSVADIHQTRVGGLEGTEYLDQVQARGVHRQTGDVRISSEVDREYLTTRPVTIHDAASGRILTLGSSGSGCTVVWNPWIAKSRTLTDLPGAAWQHFLCVETANAWRDTILLPPGGRHVLRASISVSRAP